MAQFKFTVLLMANGPLRITSGPVDLETIESSHSLEDKDLKVSEKAGQFIRKSCLYCVSI